MKIFSIMNGKLVVVVVSAAVAAFCLVHNCQRM